MKIKTLISVMLLLTILVSAVACTVTPEAPESSESESESMEIESVRDPEQEETSRKNDDETVDSDESTDQNGGEIDETEESETEDPRLSSEYAPVVYFSGKDIYELTKDGIYEDMAQLFHGYDEVTYFKEKGQRGYTRILAYNDYQNVPEVFISLCTSPMEVAPIFAIKYRTTTPGISMEVYTDSVNQGVTSGNIIRIPVESDGDWHVEYVNLNSIKQFNGSLINYFRFDIMNATKLPVDAYVDFEYFGFFNSDEEVEMFETGKYVPVIYVDPNSGYTDATGEIVHASSIDMINGMGGSGAGKFDYRGGDTLKGVDKFNHNGTTLSGGKLVFSGWTVVDGGIEKYVWSVDGLNWYDATLHQMGGMGDLADAHINATQSYTGVTVIDTENAIKGGGYQGNINATHPEDRARGLACDLLTVANVGDKVNVRFAAVPKSDPTKLCLIAYVKNVEVVSEFEYEEEPEVEEIIDPTVKPEDCKEHESSYYWYPVEGEQTEVKLCLKCGSTVESRSVAFYSSFDVVEDKNGPKNTGLYGANKTFENDGAYIVLRNGYDFVLQGWFAVNGGVKDYMYSVDGGETWLVCGNSDKLVDRFPSGHISAIENANLGIAKYDVKGMYRVNLPLKQFASETETTVVNILFGAKLANNESVIITIASIKNVNIPVAPAEGGDPAPKPEPEAKFDKSTDNLCVGDTTFANPSGNVSGELFTFDASAAAVSVNKTVKWQGWAAVEGGFSGWAYSLDGGETWTDFAEGYSDMTRSDVIAHLTNIGYTDALKNGNVNLSVDLSAYDGMTVSVIFGGYAVNDPETVIPMVEIINIKVIKACQHEGVKWQAVEGQLKETFSCSACGKSLTRDVKYLNNIDSVEGTLDGASHVINPPDGVDLVSKPTDVIASRIGKDIVVQGWLAVNGGLHKYVYSVDGGATWLECGNQPNYKDATFASSEPHIKAINRENLGFTAEDADINGRYRVSCDLSSKAGETVTVIFGAILENNKEAEPLQVMVITVEVMK